MFSVIIVPDGCRGLDEQYRLEPGHTLRFGRTAPTGSGLALSHPSVACAAGEITATGAFWILTNFSSDQTYLVENPEGAGEHIRVAPGRADAPVPFEFARVRLCAGDSGAGCGFDVLAPRHDYLASADSLVAGSRSRVQRAAALRPGAAHGDVAHGEGNRYEERTEGPSESRTEDPAEGGTGDPAEDRTQDWGFDPFPRPYPLDHSCHYFLVLAALCEAPLRGDAAAPVPDVVELTERLRPAWPDASPAAVAWNIDYLRLKLRLRAPDAAESVREALVRFALRFDLVQEAHLAVLDGGLAHAGAGRESRAGAAGAY
ncbi:hypothetical protein [Streptomyces qinglanensis]|uniref:hypothetical protein n=1 Tax=Streptomyces qinglanensis TaxID=943816 RepID=UPI003D732E1A